MVTTGRPLWKYSREMPKGVRGCCGEVNRGVALHNGKVYVGTLDARLIALDAKSGNPVWSVMTGEAGKPYSITGYPRIAKNLVVIGNAGSEYGVRGYVSAFDAETSVSSIENGTGISGLGGSPAWICQTGFASCCLRSWR